MLVLYLRVTFQFSEKGLQRAACENGITGCLQKVVFLKVVVSAGNVQNENMKEEIYLFH